MRIGELAVQAGVPVATVRYYEQRGLIPEPPRTSVGYREYDNETATRIRFIKHAQKLGFTLTEVEELLAMRVRPDSACEDVKVQAEQKISQVQKRIHELRAMEEVLNQLVISCEVKVLTGDCPILEVLEGREDG